jgi:hypothetical protein
VAKTRPFLEKALNTASVVCLAGGAFAIGLLAWSTGNAHVVSHDNYSIECVSGKRFDPFSKPIMHTPIDPFGRSDPWQPIITFDDAQLKSECAYGTAFRSDAVGTLPNNYAVTVTTVKKRAMTPSEQFSFTLVAILLYCVAIEYIRRSILYVFLGRSFSPLKQRAHKKNGAT